VIVVGMEREVGGLRKTTKVAVGLYVRTKVVDDPSVSNLWSSPRSPVMRSVQGVCAKVSR
jgi:hypothetical protein